MSAMLQEMTLTNESIADFQKSLIVRGRSALTVKAYSTDLRMLLVEMSVVEVSLEDLETTAAQWLNLMRQVKSPKTNQRRLTSVKAFANWIGLSILQEYKPPMTLPPLPHPIPEGIAGIRTMLSHAKSPQTRALIALCGLMGLRVAETLAVTPGCFDLDRMILTVRGKGDVTRQVPLSSEAFDATARAYMMAGDGPLVTISDRGARAVVSRIGERALGHHVASHDLRMTFGTAVNQQYGLRVAQLLLGHASSKTTELYTLVTLDELRKAVNL